MIAAVAATDAAETVVPVVVVAPARAVPEEGGGWAGSARVAGFVKPGVTDVAE